MSIDEIVRDEANKRRAKRQHRNYNLIFSYDPILDGVDLDEIFKLDYPSIKHNKNNGLYRTTDVDDF